MIPTELIKELEKFNIGFAENAPTAPLSTFRIGGTVELAISPKNAEQLSAAVSLLNGYGVRFFVLGNGSNVLFCDGVLEGAVILTQKIADISVSGHTVKASAGASLAALANAAARASLSGIEFAKGIPGTFGGAVYMNAGAYGGSISDVLTCSTALNIRTGELEQIREHNFGYRASVYMSNNDLICVGAELELRDGNREEIEASMQAMAQKRRASQPLEYPSAGSYFKRPEGYFAGKLIEDCGLKGARIGGAAVSDKHAGFIINLGCATADDVLRLEENVRTEVLSRFGVTLEREVRLIR